MGLSYWHGAAPSPSANAEQGCVSCSSLVAQCHLLWALHLSRAEGSVQNT